MNFIYRFLLTLNATSLLIVIFLIKEQFREHVPDNSTYNYLISVVYILTPLILTFIIIKLCSKLSKTSFNKGEISSIEHANNSFLPSYLSYFFVALSIADMNTLIFVYSILFLFTFYSQALYFNPLFLIFGFEFYNLKTTNGASIFLISRTRYKTPTEIEVDIAYSINDYTFIEISRD